VLKPSKSQSSPWWEEAEPEVFEPPSESSESYIKLIGPEEIPSVYEPQLPGAFLSELPPIAVSRDPSIRATGHFETISEDGPIMRESGSGYDFNNDDPEMLFRAASSARENHHRRKKRGGKVPKTPETTPRASLAHTPRTSAVPPVAADLMVDAHWVSDPANLPEGQDAEEGDTPEDSQYSSPVGSYSCPAVSSSPELEDFLNSS